MKLTTLKSVADTLRSEIAGFEPELMSGSDAAQVLEAFAELEKLAAAGKLLAARRVESSNIWRKTGHRSAAAHVAEATGTGLGPAITALEAARQLGSLPATDEAMRDGRLSESQIKEIAGAAAVQPDAEQELVDAAGKQPMSVLKLRCRRVKATGPDQAATYRAIHKGRYLRNWTDADGAMRFDARLTPDEGARLAAAVKDETDRLVGETRRAGVDEPRKALAVDALVRLACGGGRSGAAPGSVPGSGHSHRAPGSGADSDTGSDTDADADANTAPKTPGSSEPAPSGPTTMVHVRVDHAALLRGHLEGGEICEIPGVGPIPVEVARRLAVDSILSVLVTDGVDVTVVAHAGRTIPASVRRALLERDQTCAVPGCDIREALEIDHIHPVAEGGLTTLSNLVRLCHWHHYLKTHQRHRIERSGTEWLWIPPDDARAGAFSFSRAGP
jgi:hypothetical protein